MSQATTTQQDVLNRLRSAAGHINGVVRMVEEDQYCIDIIQQIQAVQAALNKVSLMVLDNHMHTCVTEAIRSGPSIGSGRGPADHLAGVRSRW
jgi:DNA-binding FrmR family transcriptional regulator